MAEKIKDLKTYEFKFDQLKLYFAEDLVVNNIIKIVQPTIGNIVSFGEDKLNASISPFVTNPTTHRLYLWKAGIDWNKLSEYQLFLMTYRSLQPEITELVFDGYDFSQLIQYVDKEENIVLCDQDQNVVLDEAIYQYMAQYLRTMFNRHPKVEKAKGRATKEAIIDEDEQNLAIQMKKAAANNQNESTLLPMISFCVNHPGFKYTTEQLKNVGIYEFMDSVQRLQIYEATHALLGGSYSGFCDTKKIPKEKFNFMRSTTPKKVLPQKQNENKTEQVNSDRSKINERIKQIRK